MFPAVIFLKQTPPRVRLGLLDELVCWPFKIRRKP